MRRILLASLLSAALMATPAIAQEDNDLGSFGPMTSAEQAEIFAAGVTAYDNGDFAEAYQIWLPLARGDNLSAMRNVAHLLRRGMGVDQDHERALYFYRRAAERGLVSAMVNLGAMLRSGQGVEEPDYREAAQWLFMAAQAGDARAQYMLALQAARGQGMEVNRDFAVELMRRAADQGMAEARQQLERGGLDVEGAGNLPERAPLTAPDALQPLPEIQGEEEEAASVPDPAPSATASLRGSSQPASPQVTAPPPQRQPEPEPEPQQVAAPAPQPEPQPAPQPVRRQPEPEPEPEEEAPEDDSPLGRLFGGTR